MTGASGQGSTTPTRVLVAGEALMDVVVSPDGTTAEHVGGSPANVAVGLATLGHPTTLATRVAPDERGSRIAAHLRDRGVPLAPGSETAVRTSTATATLDAGGAASYDFDLTWDLGPVDVTGCGHVHTGSLAATLQPGAAAVLDLVTRSRETATVSYDPNARPTLMGPPHEARSRIEELVGLSDVVKASDEDLRWLYDDAPVEQLARLWGQLGAGLVVVTRGGSGAHVLLPWSGVSWEAPAPQVAVVDTVGAGDSFMAGLLSGLLDTGLLGGPDARQALRHAGRADVEPAVSRALATAGFTVGRAGAVAPSRSDLPS